MKYLLMLVAMATLSVLVVACDKDKEKDAGKAVAGDYGGTVQEIGYTETYQAYVTLTRRSENAVSFLFDCDAIDLHPDAIILDVVGSDGSYALTHTSKAITGTVINDHLTITFNMESGETYTFSGKK